MWEFISFFLSKCDIEAERLVHGGNGNLQAEAYLPLEEKNNSLAQALTCALKRAGIELCLNVSSRRLLPRQPGLLPV